MSIGYHAIIKLRRVEDKANHMGFSFGPSKASTYGLAGDAITLYPWLDKLPEYSRDAALFTGNLDEVDTFLIGVQWSNNYLKMLRLVTDEKIERKEQDIRNRQLVQLLKDSA